MHNLQTNMNTKNKSGYLELIVGPMYASKTTRLLELYKQCIFCNIPVAVINYIDDTRYDDTMLSTHDLRKIPCIQTRNLSNLWNFIDNSKTLDILNNSDVILINEGQFFPDLFEFVVNLLKDDKKIYVCGLDGDFERKKFGTILDLIPLCDKVTKLTSLCSLCKNGKAGIFSMRLTNEKEQTVVGSENYIPVCRECYKKNNIQL